MMTTKPFVFENVPEIDDKENYLTDYFESILNKDVKKLDLLSAIPDRTLVTFNDDCLDIDETNETLKETPLEDVCLRVAVAVEQNAVLLDRRQYSHFESYLESRLEAGKEVVQQTFPVPGSELVAVCISSADALEIVLRQKEINVQSFIRNFHGCIQLDGHPMSEVIETAGKKAEKKAPPQLFPKPRAFLSKPEKSPSNVATTPDSPSGGEATNSVKNLIKTFGGNLYSTFWRHDGPKEDQVKLSEPLPEKQEETVEIEENSDDGEDKEDEGNIEDSPEENSDESDNTGEEDVGERKNTDVKEEDDGEEEDVEEKEPTDVKEEDDGEDEKQDSIKKSDSTPELEKQPKKMTFLAVKSPQLSSSTSQKMEAKQAVELQADNLDIDEHIWNLIEGRLDQSDFHSLKYHRRSQVLKFSSLNPKACRDIIDDLRADIVVGAPLEIPEHLRVVFSDLQKKDFFASCKLDYFQRFEVQVFIQDNSIFFYGWDDEYIDKTKAEIRHRFMYTDEIVNEHGMDIGQLRQEKLVLEDEFLVSISWTDSEASTVKIQGVYDDISFAKQALEDAMLKYKARPGSFEFSEEHALYVEKHCQHKLDSVLQRVEVSFRGQKNGKYIIEYLGKSDDISIVSKALHEMKGKIKIENIDVSKDLDSEVGGLLVKAIIHKRPNSPFSREQNLFEIQTKCCILNDVTEMQTARAQKRMEKRQRKDSTHFEEKQLVSVQMSPSLKVEIKASGNIVKEKADVLVCPLHESGSMGKLRISKAFQAKDSSLQGKVGKCDFSASPVHFCKMTCEKSGLEKDVAVVVLSTWTKSMPENYLCQLICETLLEADKLGAKTVSFPPMGLGMVLKYPAAIIARQFFSAVKEFQEKAATRNIQLTTVNILACDTMLCKCLQSECYKFQSASHKKRRELEEAEEETLEESVPPQVTLRLIHGEGIKDLASLWKEKFKSLLIHDEFCLNSFCSPTNLDHKLKKKVRNLVIVMDKAETDSGELVYKFRGLNEDILIIKEFIANEVHRDMAKLSHVLSEHSPPRGTLEFIEYAASINELAPSYWTHQTRKSLGGDLFREVEVEAETAKAIKDLFLSTYDSSAAGRGFDAQNIPRQSTIEFLNVKRIENIGRFEIYAQARKKVFEKKCHEKEVCKSISDVSKRGQGSLLEPYLSESMKEHLCHEVNECYLLHGTKPDIIETIKRNGCDPKVSSDKAMFGKGVYTAECATKCDQYTDDPQKRLPAGSIHYAFLLRVLLGDIFVCDDSHVTVQSRDCPKLNRPPCKSCLKDKCLCAKTNFYDSVMGEGKWIFREFVIYEPPLCYPEYIISYKRM